MHASSVCLSESAHLTETILHPDNANMLHFVFSGVILAFPGNTSVISGTWKQLRNNYHRTFCVKIRRADMSIIKRDQDWRGILTRIIDCLR